MGLLVESGRSRSSQSKILLTNEYARSPHLVSPYSLCSSGTPFSLTGPVLDEALENSISLIVSYHPPIFTPFKRLTFDSPQQSLLVTCIENGISVYSPHTALDITSGGINDWLAKAITGDLDDDAEANVTVSPVTPLPDQPSLGQGKLVSWKEGIKLTDLVSRIKQKLNLQHREYQR